MPEGGLLAILVLLGVLAVQLVLVVTVQRLRDSVRRRRGLPSILEQRAHQLETHGDERLVPIGNGLPGVILPGGRRGVAPRRDRGGADGAVGTGDPAGAHDGHGTDPSDRAG